MAYRMYASSVCDMRAPLQLRYAACGAMQVVVIVVVVVDLYSASRSASNALNVPMRRKKMSFSADLKLLVLRTGSRSQCGSEFNSIGPATEKARRPNVCDGVVESSTGDGWPI